MQIETRPHFSDARLPLSVSAIILAAGKASRMGEAGHKLLAEFDGVPLIRRTVMTTLGADVAAAVVVTGYRCLEIEDAISGIAVRTVENPDYASGMASSLRTGLADVEVRHADGVLVILADMPGVTPADLDILIAAFRTSSGGAIIRAASDGKRGNPVILSRALYDAVDRLEGDVGARHIIETADLPVVDIDIGAAAHLDVDTPEAVVAAGGILRREQ